MWIGAARIEFILRDARSLKDRRRVAAKLRDRVLARFDAAVAILGHGDDPQRLVVGFSVVGNDPRVLRATVDKILGFVDDLYLAPMFRRESKIERFLPDESDGFSI